MGGRSNPNLPLFGRSDKPAPAPPAFDRRLGVCLTPSTAGNPEFSVIKAHVSALGQKLAGESAAPIARTVNQAFRQSLLRRAIDLIAPMPGRSRLDGVMFLLRCACRV
jgi:hypothetical protein